MHPKPTDTTTPSWHSLQSTFKSTALAGSSSPGTCQSARCANRKGRRCTGKRKIANASTLEGNTPSFSSPGPQALLTKLQLLLRLTGSNSSSSINLSNDLSISQKHFASTKCQRHFFLHTSPVRFITCHISIFWTD